MLTKEDVAISFHNYNLSKKKTKTKDTPIPKVGELLCFRREVWGNQIQWRDVRYNGYNLHLSVIDKTYDSIICRVEAYNKVNTSCTSMVTI